ncbi:MAG: hypothetical protein H6873_05460 [Hyphomicrobiaceae bacterium]|nr:hypothetical protein [Hyphomicrobiaceae bacterium]
MSRMPRNRISWVDVALLAVLLAVLAYAAWQFSPPPTSAAEGYADEFALYVEAGV